VFSIGVHQRPTVSLKSASGFGVKSSPRRDSAAYTLERLGL
jgi:hypothetical protein